MKKNSLRFIWTILLSIVFAGLTAQNIPINLNSGWNWISYPRSEAMSLEAAMEGFTPASGDMIKGMSSSCTYQNGQWQGGLTDLVPGEGYMYYSASGQTKSFVFGGSEVDSSMLPEAALDGEFTVDNKGTRVKFSPGNLQYRTNSTENNTAQVGDGTVAQFYMPYNTYYKYSLCQMVFRAGELSDAGLAPGTITGLAFESYSANHYLRNNIEIWVSSTTLTTAPSTSVSTSGHTKVYSGSMTQQDGWTATYFSSSFTWDGTSNLLVTVAMNHGSYNNNTLWQSKNLSYSCACFTYNDANGAYAPASSTYAMTTADYRPNVRFIGQGVGEWRFATNQTDCIGTNNAYAAATYGGWIDLFGWGTSGHGHGAVCYQPWSTNQTSSQYYAYGNSSYNLYDGSGEADWGCNSIENGGNQPFQWRTLTKAEWGYLLSSRSTSSGRRYAKATVNGKSGVILLPDNWSTSYYSLSSTNSATAGYSSNVITAAQWRTLEQHGAVFLPAAGSRYGTTISDVNDRGYYWTSSWDSENSVSRITFQNTSFNYSGGWAPPYCGCAVRLVCQSNPRVRTLGVTNITGHTATVSAEVFSSGTNTIDNHGFNYKVGNTTYNLTCGYGSGSYTTTITGLLPGTTYRVRAFAKINGVNRYGNYITFTTAPQAEGTTEYVGLFSVSATKKVEFSKGNLQYQASTDTWRFAPNQYSYIGDDNANASETYDGWIDLFGWGSSGHSHGSIAYQPWNTNYEFNEHYAYGSYYANLNDEDGTADWGCNPISNGGNLPNQWRTLTQDEWVYLFETRSTSSGIRYAMAKVSGVNGVILLPNNWLSSYYTLNDTNNDISEFSSNVITASQWNTLEQHGAIFLPAAGNRVWTSVIDVGSSGYYWSASYSNCSNHTDDPGCVRFEDSSYGAFLYSDSWYYPYMGQSVRLVRDAR